MTRPPLVLSMVFRIFRLLGFTDITGASDEALLALWRQCAPRPDMTPAAHVLSVAWRDASTGTLHANVARDYLHESTSSNWRLADALASCCLWATILDMMLPPGQRIQVCFLNVPGPVVAIEQCHTLQQLPGTRRSASTRAPDTA
jgi:hypothetical protein